MTLKKLSGCAAGLCMFLTICFSSAYAAKDNSQAGDIDALHTLEASWRHDVATKDIDKIVSHYDDDATLMLPGVPAVNGKTAIRTVLAAMFADPNIAMDWKATSTVVSRSRDLAYIQGTATVTMTDSKTKAPVTSQYKYLTVYKKGPDGSWKAIEDISNTDTPSQ